jgi:hypothetical protein
MTTIITRSLFPLGQTVITRNALGKLHPEDIQVALARHAGGDWGECGPQDARANDTALADGSRLLSVYRDRHGERFWIITEWNRSATTILLPEDY